MVVITAFISPFEEDPFMAREMIGEDRFVEVFVDTSLMLCMERDPKGSAGRIMDGLLAEGLLGNDVS